MSSSSSIYSEFVDSRSPSPLSSDLALYIGDSDELDSDMATSACRTPSVLSYDPARDASEMLREENGRIFNTKSDTYYLPSDEIEFERQGLQHQIHCTILGGLYPGADVVEKALAPEWGVEKGILDVGTGPGHWAIDMARRFPHCHVVGVDLAPRTSNGSLPSNLRLEFDDANLGFPHYHGCFDVVHSRGISNGISDFESYVRELSLCLRPGGVLIIAEPEHSLVGANMLPVMPAGVYPVQGSWFTRIAYEASHGIAARGVQILTDAPNTMSRALDHTQTFPFQSQRVQTVHVPIGPWLSGSTEAETRRLHTLGELMRRCMYELIDALKPLIQTRGIDPSEIEIMSGYARQELTDLSVPLYLRWTYAYAVKPLASSSQHPPHLTSVL